MNKLLIVLMAVCLVNVHAFVKRDTAAATQTNDLLNEIQRITSNIKEDAIKQLDPEKIKAQLNSMVDQLNNLFKPLAAKADAPKE